MCVSDLEGGFLYVCLSGVNLVFGGVNVGSFAVLK